MLVVASSIALTIAAPATASQPAMLDRSVIRPAVPATPSGPEWQAFGWGVNGEGELGYGTPNYNGDDSVPGQVLNGANATGAWSLVTANQMVTCGLAPDGSAYCWGDNSDGQLGNGTNDDDSRPAAVVAGPDGPASWLTLDAGYAYVCGIGMNQSAYCWGYNDVGQLGMGTIYGDDSLPALVLDGANASGSWSAISAGDQTTCGLDALGHAYCWGDNSDGQLGNGTDGTYDDSVPTAVLPGANTLGTWSMVSVAEYHACGIAPDGRGYCWGSGSSGTLGTGSYASDSEPAAIASGGGLPETWRAISAYGPITCGIGNDDSAYCWGQSSYGQLGPSIPIGDDTNVPVHIDLPGDPVVKTIAVSQESVCATTADSVYCWGGNSYGQLGIGVVSSVSPWAIATPQLVTSPLLAGLGPVSVSLGYFNAFLLAGPAPTLSSLSPTSGAVSGGTPVTLAGSHLSGTTSVTFDGAMATITARSSTQVSVTTPPGAAGAVDVTVTTPAGSATLAGAFTYGGSPTPPGPTPGTVPSPPWSPQATAGAGSATVTWLAPADAGAFPVSTYQVSAHPGAGSCLANAPARTCTVPDLIAGTAYTFTVRALNGAGWSPSSASSNEVTPSRAAGRPGSVTDLRVTDRAPGAVTLAWQAPRHDGGASVTSYRVWYRPAGTTTWVRHRPNPTATTVTIEGLTPSTRYRFKVAAVNEAGRGPATRAVTSTRIPR